MKILVTYLLCSLMLSQAFQIDWSQSSKFNNLTQHYKFHQEEFGDDFWSFVDLHYGKQQGEHEDEHSQHQQLPTNDYHNFYNYNVYLNTNNYEVPIALISISSEVDISYTNSFSYLACSDIFQPPKYLIDYKS